MKKTIRDNYRIIVEPHLGYQLDSGDKNHNYNVSICEDIIEQIERHVDDVDYLTAEWDEQSHCTLCGNEWEEKNGVPTCCKEAVDEVLKNKIDELVP